MREIRTETVIAAPPAAVWAVLADTERYGDWNPFVTRLTGALREGGRIRVRLEPPGRRGMTFRPRVVRVAPERELRWRGRLGVPGLFDGEHALELAPAPGGGTRLVHGERFRGLLVGLLGGTIAAAEQGFHAMNAALAAEAEARARRGTPAPV
ncbi:MAG TPA: SRPBCC domain-containing protein [Miltoncostaeaceae bacterium]|nr:SRPBCC domain-containing protein [Miltoncostaeaceae bacterium]